jgi:biopolymer transport protein ExbB
MIKNKTHRFLPAILALAALFVSSGTARAEENIIQLIIHGGPMIIFIWLCILATSIIMVTLIIQNAIGFKKDKLAPPPLVDSLRQLLNSGNYQEAWETCNANKNYLANVLKAGLSRIGRGKEAVENGIAEHGLREATLLRTRNSYLSVIGVVSPMIGLLGTVIGMMGAFAVLGQSGTSDPKMLSNKISEVLLATAAGLFIAIPAFVAYYIFRNVSQASIVHSDDLVNQLLIDVPYEELAGMHIGDNFSGAPMPARQMGVAQAAGGSANCPVCAGVVAVGSNPCPHCGSVLSW